MAKKGLGRGLDAILPSTRVQTEPAGAGDAVTELKLIDIEPDSGQPRKNFDDEGLNELAASIKEHGVITPILVHKSENGFYKIIAGERRWRASKLAGKKTIPAIVKDYDRMKVYEISLIENLQRQDLNPVEEALGYRTLMNEFDLTQEQIAVRLSKSRSSIANSLRLLNLCSEALDMLAAGDISVGHAKILAGISDASLQASLAQIAAKDGISVRELEKLIKKQANSKPISKKTDINTQLAFEAVEKNLSDIFSTRVKITNSKGNRGKITIDYYSGEDLERISNMIGKIGK